MINSVTTTSQTVAINSNVLFPTDRVRTRSCRCACRGWLTHDLGSGLFTLTKGGIYQVMYNANVTGTVVGTAILDLKVNGEAIGGSRSIYTIATANALGNMSATSLIQVPCNGSLTLSLANDSTIPLIIQDANIIVKKIA